MPRTIRPATEADVSALKKLDATYEVGRRVLALKRSGSTPELTFSFRWREGTPSEAVYDVYTPEGIRSALSKTDLFLVADAGEGIAGLLMIVEPPWTDAAEITDLVVDRRHRRCGAGRSLVSAAVDWAHARNPRALWVEPRADNAGAIEFYLSLGFRISGFNDRWASNEDGQDGRATIFMHVELPEKGTR